VRRRAVLRPCWAGEEAEGAEGVAGVEEDGAGGDALAGGVVGADIAPRNTPLLRFRGRTMSREDGAVTLGFPRSQPSIDDPTAYICRRRGSIECSSLVQD